MCGDGAIKCGLVSWEPWNQNLRTEEESQQIHHHGLEYIRLHLNLARVSVRTGSAQTFRGRNVGYKYNNWFYGSFIHGF